MSQPPSRTCASATPAILGRLDAFLPAMRAANADLHQQQSQDPTSGSIEAEVDPDTQHIEMVCRIPHHGLLPAALSESC